MRRTKKMQVALLALSLGAVTATAHAQVNQDEVVLESPSPRQGYYLGLGLLGLAIQNIEEGDSLGWWSGSAFTFHLGQMVTRRFGLGIGIDMAGAVGEADGRKQLASIFGLSIEAQTLLFERLAVHAGVGIGAAQVQYETLMPDEDNELRGTAGSYYLLGVSYDFFPYERPISGGLALSPSVRARFIPGEDFSAVALMFGLQVTWWTGLPNNQLDLPPDKAYTASARP